MPTSRSLEQVDAALRVVESKIGDLIADTAANVETIKNKASKASLNTETTRLTNIIEDINEELSVVSKKLNTIFTPDETIAYIGEAELRTMRLRITQLESLRNEIQTMATTVTDMVVSWNESQTGVIP